MGRIKFKYTSQEHLDQNTWIDARRLCSLFGCEGVEQLFARYPRLNGTATQTSDGPRWCLAEVKAMLPGSIRSLDDAMLDALADFEDDEHLEHERAADRDADLDLIDRAEVERMAGRAFDGMRLGLVQLAQSTPEGLRWARADVQWLCDVTMAAPAS